MKTVDFWGLLLVASMPEKPLPLEGMWRSCDSKGDGDLEYVADFKQNELVEDYYGSASVDGTCGGRRLFHYRRTWKLTDNNFKFKTTYKESSYLFRAEDGYRNWYGCCYVRVQKGRQKCDIHAMAGDHDLDFNNEFDYTILGETLKTHLKGNNDYLKRIQYPLIYQSKQYLLEYFYGYHKKAK
jgi:hypothetical protein